MLIQFIILVLNKNKYIWVLLKKHSNLEAQLIFSKSKHIKVYFLTNDSSLLTLKKIITYLQKNVETHLNDFLGKLSELNRWEVRASGGVTPYPAF